MKHAVCLMCCAAVMATAQSKGPGPVVIDGKLDDHIWQDLAPEKLIPFQAGVPAEMGGEIRAAVVGRYLYVAARLPEPSGRLTARVTGRNPSWEDEDALRITAGADIGYTDRVLQVNPLGAYSVEKALHVTYRNEPTYPYADEWERQVVYQNLDKWLAATWIGDTEWTVEAAIPLNELSAPASDPILVTVERIRAQRPGLPRETWYWPKHGVAAKVTARRIDKWDSAAPVFRPVLRGNQEPPIEAGFTKELPSTSGWDEAPWREAPTWRLTRDEPSPRLPRFPTEVRLLHDSRTLAILAKCIEPEDVVARVKENDGPVEQDDSFHVYLSTSGSAYARFVVNALGYLLDADGWAGGERVSRPREWDSGARVAVRRESGAWLVRMDIPLEAVAAKLGEMKTPREWRVLFERYRPGRAGEPRETSVLPVIESQTAFCPPRYRRLTLADRPPSQVARPPAAAPEGPLASLDTRVFTAEQRKQMNLPGMVSRQLRERIRLIVEAEKRDRDQMQDRAGWERFRDPRLKALRDSLGAFPPRTPLHARVTKEFAGQDYRRLDLLYESRPGLWVTSNLYLPEKPAGKRPAIVIIHSHHRPRTQAELQDMGILWARLGCVVLIPDMIGHGERLATYPWNREGYHSRYLTGMQLYVAGESLLKWLVWDIMRGVDLLVERNDVNPAQIVLLGAVAAGGDPAAVTAALDPRIAAVAPFNFGEATPERPPSSTRTGQPSQDLADPGSGEWESTRYLPRSLAGQFFPWFVCASVAPRRLVYSYEMGWKVEETAAWARYRKVFGFYDALDNLDEAHGFGTFPGPGECANIGPSQRKTLYPKLNRWFGIPIPPKEPDDRRPEAELTALTPSVAAELGARELHQAAYQVADAKLGAARAELARLAPEARVEWLKTKWAAKLGDIGPNPSVQATLAWEKTLSNARVEAYALAVEPGITVPLLLLRPAGAGSKRIPVVVGVSENGKERMAAMRGKAIVTLLENGFAVCLPDVRGTGETSPDSRHGPSSPETSLAATELMFGETLLGARLKDLRTVLAWIGAREDLDPRRIALWGDSFAPPNPLRIVVDEAPNWQIGPEIQHQAEPLGGLLAILGALYQSEVRAVAVRGGLASYMSILQDRFVYVPKDVIVPGVVEAGDIGDIVAALAPRAVLLEDMVDGRNRLVSRKAQATDVAAWLRAHL